MAAQDNKTLVDILVASGALTPALADKVRAAEVQTGKPEEDIVRDQNLVSEQALTKAKAVFYNIPYIDLASTPLSPDALSFVPQNLAERFNLFPINVDRTKRELTVAMADPLDLSAIEFIEQRTKLRVKPVSAEGSAITNFIATRYETSLSQEVTEALKDVEPSNKLRAASTIGGQEGKFIRGEKIGEVINKILEFAVKARASDVHIEPQESGIRVRYRIDGILQERLAIPRELLDPLVSRIKILSGLKIIEKRIPQDGRFNFKVDQQDVDLRVSTLPTAWGEKIVMRLLKKSGGVPTLSELGLRGNALKNLEDSILRPHGIILICGPTGSGKTTTLYSIIERINTPKVNIMTLEDPIEYKIQGVNQVQINPAVGLTFASGLRAFLRQDPNVILVGEIRDKETADLAIQAALTGHLVFATLHTNDSAGALPRLIDMGAEPFLLASTITAIVAQRVLRKIDPAGKVAYDPDVKVQEDIRNILGPFLPKDHKIQLFKGTPTPENNNSGYLGRVAIFEVLPVTEKISHLILSRVPASEIEKEAKVQGMITLKQDGYLKAVDGTTSIEEVLRVAQE